MGEVTAGSSPARCARVRQTLVEQFVDLTTRRLAAVVLRYEIF